MLRAPPRRTVVTRLAVLLGIGLAFVLLCELVLLPQMRQYLDAYTDRADAMRRLTVVLAIVGAIAMAVAIHACALGIRTLRSGQWPLASAFVLRDTPIRRGRAARFRGILLIVLGVVVALDAALLPFIPYFITRSSP